MQQLETAISDNHFFHTVPHRIEDTISLELVHDLLLEPDNSLTITGIRQEHFPPPPNDLRQDCGRWSDKEKLLYSAFRATETHYRYCIIESQTTGKLMVPSYTLLPSSIWDLYGYQKDPAELLDCHAMSVLFHQPQHRGHLHPDTHPAIIIREFFRVLKTHEKPRFGDLILYNMFTDEGYAYPHTVVYISPKLVLSRNGKYAWIPFCLQERRKVNDGYAPYGEFYANLKYFRLKQ